MRRLSLSTAPKTQSDQGSGRSEDISEQDVGNLGVDNNVLSLAVLEETENSKAVLDAILNDQAVKQLGPCGKHAKGAKQPTIAKYTLLHISRLSSGLLHLRLVIWTDLLSLVFP